MNKGSIVERLCSDMDRKEPRYKSPTLLYFNVMPISAYGLGIVLGFQVQINKNKSLGHATALSTGNDIVFQFGRRSADELALDFTNAVQAFGIALSAMGMK